MASTERGERRLSDIPEHVRPFVHLYDGLILPTFAKPFYVDGIRQFEMRASDTFLVTWPKSGTTWTQYILSQILRGQEFLDNSTLQQSCTFLEFPQIEQMLVRGKAPEGQYKSAVTMPSPRIIKSHLPPLCLLPSNLLERGVKIVYVARNPKDAAVSYYNHTLMDTLLPCYTDWNEFCDQLCKGLLPYGDWFEHVLTWWKLRDHPNVLFLKYEDMKKDLKDTIRTVSGFLARAVTEKEVEEICEKSSFQSMRANEKVNPDAPRCTPEAWKRPEGLKIFFMRKGEIGDWKNWFTVAQSEHFDEIYRSRMDGTGLEFTFV